MNLWLDDIRPAPKGFTWAKTYDEAVHLIQFNEIESMSLDHDLGLMSKTGYDFVKWMAENNVWPKNKPKVHSMNPVGRENMIATINRYFEGIE